ncbi:MAG: Sec-independent protein translocase subunit TatA/TatB [Opitutales bacterium]
MQTIAFIQNLSSWEIILIFLVVLLFFGAKRLPELFKSLGKSLREFKKATADIEDDIRTAMEEDPEPARPTKSPKKKEPITEPKQVESQAAAQENTPEFEAKEKEPATKA